MCLSVVSRPDICFAVYNLAQFVSNPGKAHWCALKHLLRFLKGTESLSLVYNRSENLELFGFSDSDWATDKNDRKSTSGFCFKLSRSGSVVSWASKKQGCVALSSCEAEYVSLALAAQEAVYLQGLLTFFCLMTVDTPVLLCGDNQGALALASNPVAHKRAKHIETRHHFIRQLVEDKRLMSPQKTTWLRSSPRAYPSLPSMSSHRNSSSFCHPDQQLNPCLPHNSIILHYSLLCLCYHLDYDDLQLLFN